MKLRPVVDVDAGRVLPQVFDLSEFRDHAGSSAISPDFCDESHSRSDKSNPVVKSNIFSKTHFDKTFTRAFLCFIVITLTLIKVQ